MIYLWAVPENFANKNVGIYNEKFSPDWFYLRQGSIISNSENTIAPVIDFGVSKNKLIPFDCIPNNTQIPLVNERLKSILEFHCKNEVQFIRSKLICTDGIIDNYYFLNATQLFKGIDKENSSLCTTSDSNHIIGFDYLKYKPNCMQSLKIARDIEYKGNLMVNEFIYELFIKEKIKGTWLVKPEDYFRPLNELL